MEPEKSQKPESKRYLHISQSGKQGVFPYLVSFINGVLWKGIVEDEIRYAFKRPVGDPVSIRSFFTKEFWRKADEATQAVKALEVFKEVGKELSIEAAAIIPGAAIGYFMLPPVESAVHLIFKEHTEKPSPALPAQHLSPQTSGLANPKPEGKVDIGEKHIQA